MAEILIPGNIALLDAHPDDAPNMAGAQLWDEFKLGHTIISLMTTDPGYIRMLEQMVMEPELGIKETVFVGHKLGIKDSMKEPDPQTYEETLGLLTQAVINEFDAAAKNDEPFEIIWTFGEDGLTGHPQHSMNFDLAKRVARERKEVKQIVTPAWSPEQRHDFLNRYGRKYAEAHEDAVPKVDVQELEYTELFVSPEGQRQRTAAIRAHGSQMERDGRHTEQRWDEEPIPREYVRVFDRQANGLFAPRGNIFTASHA